MQRTHAVYRTLCRARRLAAPSLAALIPCVAGCGSAPNGVEPLPPPSAQALSQPYVYGADDRRELYEAESVWQSLARSVVAIGLSADIVETASGELTPTAPPLRDRAEFCSDERFLAQPTMAVCTAIVLDPTLVLTAEHCLRTGALDELSIVRGYAYEQDGVLARLAAQPPLEIVASDAYYDYAWLRVAEPLPTIEAATVSMAAVPRGAGVASLSYSAGVPLKVDTGGSAFPLDAESLVTTLDAFLGASGAPVFAVPDSALDEPRLLGLLTSGSADYEVSDAGCVTSRRGPDAEETANELVLGLDAALDGLCRAPRASTGELCARRAPAVRSMQGASSCALVQLHARQPSAWLAELGLLLLLWWVRRGRALRRLVREESVQIAAACGPCRSQAAQS